MARCQFCGWDPINLDGSPKRGPDGFVKTHHDDCKEAKKLRERALASHVSEEVVKDETADILAKADAIRSRQPKSE
jgi:hypothetical protein